MFVFFEEKSNTPLYICESMFIQKESIVKFAAPIRLGAVTQPAESCLDLLDLLEKKIIRHEKVDGT